MKKLLSLLTMALILGLGAAHFDAEARRLGGGRSLGIQRQITPPSAPAKAPTATPASTPAPAGAAAATPRRNWLGPIAGLAAGLGLAALASHLGLGEGFANILMIALLAMAAVAVFRLLTRSRAAPAAGGVQYAGAGAGQAPNAAWRMPAPAAGGASTGGSIIGSALGGGQPQGHIPADFDAAGFVRHAKVNFMRLQAAYDAGNLDDIREFTTPEMFAEIQMDLRERGGATQRTEVEQLDAQVLDVAEEPNRYVVSIRFTGTVIEDGQRDTVNEVWHLIKPRQGSGGWVLAGIQQVG
jgi:predicted lipid-binding transport protein (Tim44 family)